MTIDLAECRAKIERAQEHREVLDAVVAPNGRSKRFNVSAEFDPDLGYHVLRVSEVPRDWLIRLGIVLGDAVHNLRGALDYLFWLLSCRYLGASKTQKMRKSVQFPIEDGCQVLTNKRKHFGKIPLAQWAVIEGAQPYYRPYAPPNLALAALRELSNRDKHQTLNPVLVRTNALWLSPALRDARPYSIRDLKLFGSRQGLEVGTKVLGVSFPSEVDPYVEMAGQTTARVMLPEGNFSLVRGVDAMILTVRRIVDSIEAEL